MKNRTIFAVVAAFLFLFVSCEDALPGKSNDLSSGEGTGGSMARFTVVGDYLYTVDESSLNTFDVQNPENISRSASTELQFGVETIFPFGGNLFLGTTSGMHIFDLSTPQNPSKLTFFEHVVSCDPVVSDGEFAYVTLSSGWSRCWRNVNELQIISLENIYEPTLVKQFPMEAPGGLAIKNDTLWVCDNGIKILDVSDKNNIVQLFHFNNINAYDVILDEDRALVIGESGFHQYRLTGNGIQKISEINVEL